MLAIEVRFVETEVYAKAMMKSYVSLEEKQKAAITSQTKLL